jgi:hypothetical protein
VPFQTMMAMFIYPLLIFFARTVDRFEKDWTGAETLSSWRSHPQTKGKILVFIVPWTHGRCLGPILALYLYFYPENYINLFYIAFIPDSYYAATFC